MGEEAGGVNLFDYLFDPASWQGPTSIWYLLLQHLGYTGAAVGIAALIAIPIGILIGHTGHGSFFVISLSNAARAIPSLGLLVLVVLLLGTGTGPIVGVLAVLALPPILTARPRHYPADCYWHRRRTAPVLQCRFRHRSGTS